MSVVDLDKPKIQKADDAIIRVVRSCVCGSDVMATGYHAAKTAHVKPGDKVVVVGDGAVGQCAVIAAKMLGASQIIMSRHEDRQKMALESGATDVVAERGTEGIEKVLKLTGGYGADAVLECVVAQGSTDKAFGVVRPGGFIGRVGLPHGAKMDPAETFYRNVTLAGGPASVTTYDKEVLLKVVLDGQINPGKVFTNKLYAGRNQSGIQGHGGQKDDQVLPHHGLGKARLCWAASFF